MDKFIGKATGESFIMFARGDALDNGFVYASKNICFIVSIGEKGKLQLWSVENGQSTFEGSCGSECSFWNNNIHNKEELFAKLARIGDWEEGHYFDTTSFLEIARVCQEHFDPKQITTSILGGQHG